MNVALALALVLVAACRPDEDLVKPDAAPSIDASPPADADPKLAQCARVFGDEITASFGRLDGEILAVIPPDYQDCPMPNRTHLTLQVVMNHAAYRMVVNVLSDQGPPDVYEHELDAPLAGAPWADGWHPAETLDYVTNFGLTSDQFVATPMAALVAKITDQLVIGAHVSVYASSSNAMSNSAHLVHRVGGGHDGAIVIDPDGAAPHWILMHFDEQIF